MCVYLLRANCVSEIPGVRPLIVRNQQRQPGLSGSPLVAVSLNSGSLGSAAAAGPQQRQPGPNSGSLASTAAAWHQRRQPGLHSGGLASAAAVGFGGGG
jgi:hypothetical protein